MNCAYILFTPKNSMQLEKIHFAFNSTNRSAIDASFYTNSFIRICTENPFITQYVHLWLLKSCGLCVEVKLTNPSKLILCLHSERFYVYMHVFTLYLKLSAAIPSYSKIMLIFFCVSREKVFVKMSHFSWRWALYIDNIQGCEKSSPVRVFLKFLAVFGTAVNV